MVILEKKHITVSLTIIFTLFLLSKAEGQFVSMIYGGIGNDVGMSVQQTSDGGYVILGSTDSFGAGSNDFLLIRLNASGMIQWQKTYGGAGDDQAYSLEQTSDGGYIVAGQTNSFGTGNYDFWILKLDSSGNVQWAKTYGGSGNESAADIKQTSDLGYIVDGYEDSFFAPDAWIIKLDASGNIQWQKAFGDSNNDLVSQVQQTADGGYIAAAYFWFGGTNGNLWIIKLDAGGNIQWDKVYYGAAFDYPLKIYQRTDNSYIILAFTYSFGAGAEDIWVLNLDSSGNILWQKTYGGSGSDYALDLQLTIDGGFIMAGYTNSFGAGSNDIWVIKADSGGNIQWQKTYGSTGDDIAYDVIQTSNGGYAVLGSTKSFGAASFDIWLLILDTNGEIAPDCSFISNTAITPINSSSFIMFSIPAVNNTTASSVNTYIPGYYSLISERLLCSSGNILLQPYQGNKASIDDSMSSTPNGIIEVNEVVNLIGHLENLGSSTAFNTTGLLSTLDPINIPQATAIYGNISAGTNMQCSSCYSLNAPLANKTSTHWDILLTENVSADQYGPVPFNYTYHIGNSFSDVSTYNIFYPYIETILHAGVVNGCTSSNYCPTSNIQRQQMAKYICRSINVSNPGSCISTGCNFIFGDVPPTNIFCSDIEALFNTGVVSGCRISPLLYCPEDLTHRQDMAKFMCLGMEAANPGACVVSSCIGIFNDVSSSNPFCSYIEALYLAGVINGCSDTEYCPYEYVPRQQMAKFIVNGFGFTL